MPIRLDIDIELFSLPNAPPPDLAALQTAVETGLADFWPALGLPASPEVHIRMRPEPIDLFDFTLRINGVWMSVPLYHPAAPVAPLAFRIQHAIFTHRTQLITDEQLRLLRAQWIDRRQTALAWNSAPLPVWRALAALLLEHGFSLNRLENCFECWMPGKSPEAAFEMLISNPETLRMGLMVHPDLAAAQREIDPGWQTRFPEYYEETYLNWGVITPQVEVEIREDMPVEHFRIRFNDLWLPVLPGLGTNQVLYNRNDADSNYFVPTEGAFFATTPGNGQEALPFLSGPWAYVLDWVRYWTAQCAGWFVNSDITDALLDNLEENNRSLVIMIREQWPVHRLCGLLRYLLRENTSIRNLSEILDVLLRIDGPLLVDDTQNLLYFPPVSRVVTIPPGVAPEPYRTDQLAGQVRAGLKYPVAFPHMRGGVLPCYNLAPPLLRDLRDGFFRHAVPFPGTAFYHLLKTLNETACLDSPKPVLIVPTGIRAAAAEALLPYFPQMTVLGNEELPPFFVPQIKAIINEQ